MVGFIVLALCSLVFAQQHGVIFPVSTTETSYTLADNAYDENNLSTGVRFSFTAPSTDSYQVIFYTGSGDFNFESCTDNTYSSCSSKINFYSSFNNPYYYTFSATSGTNYYFKITDYNTSHSTYTFTAKYQKTQIITLTSASPNCSTSVTSLTVLSSGYYSFTGYGKPGYSPNGWTITSGTATIGDSTASTISLKTSSDVSLELQCEARPIYPLTSTFSGFTYDKNSSTTNDGSNGIRTSFTASDTSTYALVTNTNYYRYIYAYNDVNFSIASNRFNCSSYGSCKYIFSALKDSTKYFLLTPYSPSYMIDSIYAKVIPTVKVNSDTSGNGYVYVGTSSRNYDSSYVAGDTLPIIAYSTTGFFNHWEKVSGNCDIIDSTQDTTKLAVQSNCKIKAVFDPPKIYAITKNVKKYTFAANKSVSGSNYEMRFYFAPTKTGAYILNFESASNYTTYIYNYSNSSFSSYTNHSSTSSYSDTLLISAGDTVFYKISPYSNYSTYISDTIKVNYAETTTHTVTVTSNSAHCKADTSTFTTFKGANVSINGSSDNGYRPNGWKFISGTQNIIDSTTASITIEVASDISLQLNCKAANLIEIDSVLREYTPINDFYEKNPSSGIRFHYTSKTGNPYILTLDSRSTDIYLYNYTTDSTFSSYSTRGNYYSNLYYIDFTPTAAGESQYFLVTPYSTSYNSNSFKIRASKAAVVLIDSSSTRRIPYGDSLAVSANIPVGTHFTHWNLVSGSGSFEDSSAQTTNFTPTSDTSKIQASFTKLPIYKLTSNWQTFILKDNGSRHSSMGMSIRTSYKATDSIYYVLQIKNPSLQVCYYLFYPDSTYDSYKVYNYNDDSLITYSYFIPKQDSTIYILFAPNSSYPFDSIQVRMLPVSTITLDADSNGSASLTYLNSNYSTLLPGDSVKLSASAYSEFRFKNWKVTSGKCKLADSSKAITTLYVTGDCKVKPVFSQGIIYNVTSTPKEYSTYEHYYHISPSYGVRFLFVAPADDDYYFVVSRSQNASLAYERYNSKAFSSYVNRRSGFNPTYTEKVSMSKGDSALFIISNYNNKDSLAPFWISFNTTTSILTVTADSNGTATPSSYDPIVNNAKYGISAYGYTDDYRFNKWNIISGSPVIEDLNAPRTLVTVKGDAEIMATFRKSQIFDLTKKYKSYNFQTHYYSDSYYDIRFTWTPTDTNTYVIQFKPVDSLAAILNNYQGDSTFSRSSASPISGATSYLVKGTPNEPLFWSIRDSAFEAADKDFMVKIGTPYTIRITSTAQGTVTPSGDIAMLPYNDTTVSARPYGGYVFSKWVIDSGNVTIENPNQSKTKLTAIDSFCIVRPTYVLDLAVQPELSITGMDLTNHPAICAQVNVVDKKSGRTIAGMDSSNFILFQDKQALPIQATTIQAVSGVSVALVIDESGSMNATKIRATIDALQSFIDGMGPYDRAAIIGFAGEGIVRIHQTMTSSKDSLLAAIPPASKFDGMTNIVEGTYAGIQQIIGETNPTTVIVFSDGLNNDDPNNMTTAKAVSFAKENNTTIYTIGLEDHNLDPLQPLAEGTGGSYTYAPDANQLSNIYESIRNSVQARYVLCYESPDQTLDNDKHEVVIKTNFNGKNSSDTTTWREDFMPPRITLTQATQDMIGVSQEAGDSIVIGAYIKSKGSLASAKIYLRKTAIPTNPFQALDMVQQNDSLWTFVIPAADVSNPGFDFYIIAEEAGSGLLGKTPAIPAPSREPYTIPVDNDVPVVKLVKQECADTTGGYGKLSFALSDTNGIYAAYIYYKDSLDILFFEGNMTYNASQKRWEAKIPAEHFREGSAEYYVRALDSTGTAVRWPKNRSRYIAACEDTTAKEIDTIPTVVVKDSIILLNGENPKSKISRSTSELALKIWSKSFSDKVDTITAAVKCLRSGDTESNVKMVEKEDGQYENLKKLYKDEYPAKKNNGSVSCEATDTLVAAYKNPETKKTVYDTVAISDFVNLTYQFLKVKDDEDLDSVKTSTKAKFRLRVTTTSPKATKIDTISVKLFTHKKDTITVNAIETDINSAVFDYTGAFYFQEDSLSMNDTLLDAVFDFNKSVNRIKIQAQCDKDSSKLADRDSLIVYSAYIPADSAEIYDKNLDGKADFVRIHFQEPLKKDIESIDSVFWPKSGHGTDYYKVKKSSIKIEDDPSWVQAKLEKGAKYGKTAPDTVDKPYLRVTKTSSDMSQKVFLADMVGAVAAKAEKHPGKVLLNDYVDSEVEIPPDTLVITMSEKIKRTGKKDAWKKLFRYSTSCEDTASRAIKIAEDPVVDSSGRVWTLVLGDYSILVGYCIRTNPDAEYIGADSNSLGIGGAEITGEDGTLYLYDVSPNPSVSGIGKKAKWIPPEGKEFKNVPDTLSTVKVMSVSPYIADIYIYDNQGQFVNKLQEKFGYNGEMEDPLRGNSSKREKLGFLYWDQRTENGRKVGTGVYIWKIFFKFTDGHAEIRTLKTGVRRSDDSEK